MGNQHGHGFRYGDSEDHTMRSEMKVAAQKFDHGELVILKQTFKDLAHRSNGQTIDKETFLKYFPLPGLIGERLFAVFDRKHTGTIDYEEFLCGLAVTCRGSFEDKMHFIFNLYDVDGDNTVNRSGLSALLNHVPSTVFKLMNSHLDNGDGATYNSGGDFESVRPNQQCGGTATSTAIAYRRGGGGSVGGGSTGTSSNEAEKQAAIGTGTGSGEGAGARAGTATCAGAGVKPENMGDGEDEEGKIAAAAKGAGGSDACGGNVNSSASSAGEQAEACGGEEKQVECEEEEEEESSDCSSNYSSELDPDSEESKSYTEFTNCHMVDQAFEECDVNHQGRLTYDQFKTWVQHSPEVLEFLQSVFPFDDEKASVRASSPALVRQGSSRRSMPFQRTHSPFSHGQASPCLLRRQGNSPFASSRGASSQPSQRSSPDTQADTENTRRMLKAALATARSKSIRDGIEKLIRDLDKVEVERSDSVLDMFKIEKEGYLWKIGHRIKTWRHRWYYLWDNCIYYYAHKEDVEPRGVMFLSGCFVEAVNSHEYESKGHFGLKIITSTCLDCEERLLFARTASERDEWVGALRRACAVVPFEDYYEMEHELGTGRFSRVYACRHRVSGEQFAVKIIDKTTIEPHEKELLRTEIAILKLVRHPHIIQMVELYESPQYIRIVMECLRGGELFDRIVGRSRFSEDEARRVIRPLLESVAYLHELGIVHRDIKPENVLCGERLCDIKIADFGLSKLVLPKEIMKMPCGTLSYVAPEVLTLQGYGKEADLWSVGVIMFLILRGKLPFDGKTKNEIIDKTVHVALPLDTDHVWCSLSREVRQVVKILLSKDPRYRTTAKEVLALPWFHNHHHHHHHKDGSGGSTPHLHHSCHKSRDGRCGSRSHNSSLHNLRRHSSADPGSAPPPCTRDRLHGGAPRPPSIATAAARVAVEQEAEQHGAFSPPIGCASPRLAHGIVGERSHGAHPASVRSSSRGGGIATSPPRGKEGVVRAPVASRRHHPDIKGVLGTASQSPSPPKHTSGAIRPRLRSTSDPKRMAALPPASPKSARGGAGAGIPRPSLGKRASSAEGSAHTSPPRKLKEADSGSSVGGSGGSGKRRPLERLSLRSFSFHDSDHDGGARSSPKSGGLFRGFSTSFRGSGSGHH